MQAKTKLFEQVSEAFRVRQQQRSLSTFCRTERKHFVHIPDWPTLLRRWRLFLRSSNASDLGRACQIRATIMHAPRALRQTRRHTT